MRLEKERTAIPGSRYLALGRIVPWSRPPSGSKIIGLRTCARAPVESSPYAGETPAVSSRWSLPGGDFKRDLQCHFPVRSCIGESLSRFQVELHFRLGKPSD